MATLAQNFLLSNRCKCVDTHERDFDVMRLYNTIEIDDKVYSVKSTIRKVKQGDKFYTYEIQEMELIEERGANPIREGATPHNGNTPITSITGATKLLNGVKKTNSNEGINFYLFKILKNSLPVRNFSSESGYLSTFRMNTT